MPSAQAERGTESTRSSIIDAAERLIAERGVAGASLREISVKAGQKNHSAAQYHFGSRDGLITTVINTRSQPIDLRRQQLLDEFNAEGGGPSRPVPRLVEILVRPWAEYLLGDRESFYLRFLARCMEDVDTMSARRSEHGDPLAVRAANTQLAAELTHLNRRVRQRRLEWLASVSLHVLADEERRGVHHAADLEQIIADLIGMLSAMLVQ